MTAASAPVRPARGPLHALRTVRTGVLALALALSLAACGEGAGDYFPLEEGWTWQYRITTDVKNVGRSVSKTVAYNRPPVKLGAETATPRVFPYGDIRFYAQRPDGIVRVIYRPEGADEIAAEYDRYVLKFPLEPGTAWTDKSKTELLKRQIIAPERVGIADVTVPLELEYTVEARGETVTVPAGTFRDCVKIRGMGKAVGDLGERLGTVDVEVESTAWFAPGAGLVKLVRRERTPPVNPMSGDMEVVLEVLDTDSWFD